MNRRVEAIKAKRAAANKGEIKCDRCRPHRNENWGHKIRRSWKKWRKSQWKDTNMTSEYRQAIATDADQWVPACGGGEKPYRTRTSRWVLYVYNPRRMEHGYLDMRTDIVEPQLRENES